VEQCGTLRRLHAGLELRCHDPSEVHDLERVLQDVLPVARAVPQPPEDLHELLVELAAVRLEHGLLAGLAHMLFQLRLRVVVHLLDPRGMDAPVLDELVERHARNFPPERIERREHDGMRRVVDDEVDAGEMLEAADVPPLAPDDPALEVVRRELDDRNGRLCRVARGDALEGVSDERPRPPPSLGAGLLLELAHVPSELVAHEVLRALDQLLLRLVHREPGHAFQRVERVVSRLLELLLERLHVHLAVAETLLPALQLGQLRLGLRLLLEDALLDLRDLQPSALYLGLDLAAELDRLLARVHLRFAADRLCLTLGVSQDAPTLVLRSPHARARERHQDDGDDQAADEDSDERRDDREHPTSVEDSLVRGLAAVAHTRRSAHRPRPDRRARASAQEVPHPPLPGSLREPFRVGRRELDRVHRFGKSLAMQG
jgi:hypothetical protein